MLSVEIAGWCKVNLKPLTCRIRLRIRRCAEGDHVPVLNPAYSLRHISKKHPDRVDVGDGT
jgi:hypothetical protein